MFSVSDAHPSDLPGAVFDLASMKIKESAGELSRSSRFEVLLMPRIGGYDLIVLSSRRLTKAEEKKLSASVHPALDQAAREWREMISKGKKEANQTSEPTARSGRGSP
jgi:hypothetical protein